MAGPWPVITALLRKRKVIVIAGLLAAGLAVFLIWGRGSSKNESYLAEKVTRGDVINTISASGMVEAENSVPLIFKNSAMIKAIYVKEGQRVKKGDLLAEQDDQDLQTQYNQQAASLKSAEAKLALTRAGARPEEISQSGESVNIARITYDQARTALERYKSLFDQGAISRVDYEKYQNDCNLAEAKYNQAREQLAALKAGNRPEDIMTAEAQVDQARAQLQAARNNLDSARMLAPDDGYIGQIGAVVGQRTSGATNTSNGADGFITLISDRLRVRAQVNEADIGRTAVGQKATFKVNSFPDREFKGVVESISPKAVTVSNVQLYEVVIALEQQEPALKVGMPANVSIITDQKSGVVLVPKIAISYAARNAASFTDGGAAGSSGESGKSRAAQSSGGAAGSGGSGGAGMGAGSPGARAASSREAPVVVLDKGKPALRQVQLGISDSTNYEVAGGLQEGDQVVIGSTSQPGGKSIQNTGAMPFGNTGARAVPRR